MARTHHRRTLLSVLVLALAVPTALAGTNLAPASAATATRTAPTHIDCSNGGRFLCTEVFNSEKVFGEGHYVGHDEPSVLFDSDVAGSGNQMAYMGQLPKEPPASNVPGAKNYDFQYYAAIWFGMAMCDTQSYPELVNTCVPDSNVNAVDPKKSPYHPGAAYMELQFYAPGYVDQWNGFTCSATQWCVALTIDSLSFNPITGQSNNRSCESRVGEEYVNFAYLTHDGKPQGPPNPVDFTPAASGNPNHAKDLFLNQGDTFSLNLHDTAHGLQAVVHDNTTGESGSMTASAANGFGQVKFAPSPSTTCKNIPYDFHPMYSTSSPKTTVPWAAATYNVAFDTEIGHFDYCSKVNTTFGQCTGKEGVGANQEKADGDDNACWTPAASSRIKISGCLDFERRLRRHVVPQGLAQRQRQPAHADDLHQPADRGELRHQLLTGRVQHGPAVHRGPAGHVRQQHRCRLLDHPAHGRRLARPVLPLLLDGERARWLRLDGGTGLPRVHHPRLRCSPAVRTAAQGGLHQPRRERILLLQRLPEHPGQQPLPALTGR